MKKKTQTIIVTVSIFLLAALIGCSMFQDVITPCHIDNDCAIYADTSLKMFTPYTSLFDAKRIAARMEYINAVGKLKYAFLKGSLDVYMVNAEQFKQTVFDPQGSIGMLVTAGLCLTIGKLGLKSPREQELEKINGNKIV